MVQRVTKSGKRPAGARAVADASRAGGAPDNLEARVVALAAERDTALAELAAARAEIAALQAARAQVVDRIDWIVDSLKLVIETER